MVIGIDGNEANVEKQVGVSVYTKNLLFWFAKYSSESIQVKVYLRSKPIQGMPAETQWFTYEQVSGPFLWTKVFLPIRLFTARSIDVFFSPAHYVPAYCPVPLIVTIHDLAYFYFPDEFLKKDLYKLKSWTEKSLVQAHKVIAVSKTTKKDIIKFYGTPTEKISVIYNGFEKETPAKGKISIFKSLADQLKIEKGKYLLYVGTLQPRKNIKTLIQAFAQCKDQTFNKLVIAGKKGWMYDDILNEAERLHIHDSVVFTGYIPDEEVISLYQNAFCFVMPSLYEGFGIPVLEAMSQGCPVISSFASSLPEVGGDGCLYFDPTNPKELAEKLVLLDTHKNMRNELIAAGKKIIKSYSWEQCAEETFKVLTQAANR
ncbi:MAG: hypothetical protein RI947_1054 [Candidatus Parcubacteria bacterium]|jgi:glycosyltransferase involved in cell wall biosynthesis